MRLGTCIALELAVVGGAVAGVWLGVVEGVDHAGSYLSTHEAAAAVPDPARPLGVPSVARLDVPASAPRRTVFGAPDAELLAPLGATPLARVQLNHGGTSLSLRLDFASGARAAFKPEQTHLQSDPRKEIAAYRIDRLLGIGHVPPAKPIALRVDDLVAAVPADQRTATAARIEHEAIAHDGVVRGELSWWIPKLHNLTIGPYHVDDADGIDLWTSYLQAGGTIPHELEPLLAQLATCVVFDVVIDNADRWSGNNTKGSLDDRTLYFMDNTLSFSTFTLGHHKNLDPLFRIQVFPRRLIARLRALTFASVSAALDLGDDPAGLGPLLTPEQIDALLARRDHVVSYVDELIAHYGKDAVLALP